MEQLTFAELEHDAKKRKTRRELFLEKMDGLIPWPRLQARVAPFYPKAGRGRRPYPLGTMLRIALDRDFARFRGLRWSRSPQGETPDAQR